MKVQQDWVASQHRVYMLDDLSHMHCPAEEWKRTNNSSFYDLPLSHFPISSGLHGVISSRWLPYVEPVLRQAAEDVPLLENLKILCAYRLYPAGGLHPLPFWALQTVLFFPLWELRPGEFDNFSRLLSTAPVRFLTLNIPMFSTLFVGPEDKTSIFLNVEVLNICADPQSAGDIVSRIGPSSGFSHFFSVLAQRPVLIRSLEISVTSLESSGARATAYVKRFLQVLEPVVRAGLQRLMLDVEINGASSVHSSVWKRLDGGCWLTLEHFECKLRTLTLGSLWSQSYNLDYFTYIQLEAVLTGFWAAQVIQYLGICGQSRCLSLQASALSAWAGINVGVRDTHLLDGNQGR
ncbi:hypothetical protein BDN67DRAFT_982290 [Paxillus ammoniavirescens]|nr:hypothetical protein BDN67DRAFT_982290 [Paxillus ammoniavirescens]